MDPSSNIVSLGLRCTRCGGPRDDSKKQCTACRARDRHSHRRRDAARRAQGICLECAEPATHGARCKYHYLWNIVAVQDWKTRDVAGPLDRHAAVALFDQQGSRCAISGVELRPGREADSASLDHKVPPRRGGAGSNAISNLQWVAQLVNRLKGDMTDGEFRVLLGPDGSPGSASTSCAVGTSEEPPRLSV